MTGDTNEFVTTDDVSGWDGARARRGRRRRRPSAYAETERHIRERRARGLFGRHAVHDGAARGLVPSGAAARRRAQRRLGGALLLRARAASGRRATAGCRATPGTTATRSCARSSTRSGARSAAPYRVLVDANQHVDREAAARSGVGFYGKNTMLITRRHGSWVVLGTLVTDGRARADAAARRRLRLVHALHRRLPDRRARRAGHARRDAVPLVLDAGARADPGGVPRGARRAGLRLRHLPGRLPLEPRRRAAPRRRAPDAGAHVDLVAWLEADGAELVDAARPAVRAAQRPALAAAKRARRARQHRRPGRPRRDACCGATPPGSDELLAEHARWALERVEARCR